MSKLHSLGFDGLHRSGKGTQITLLTSLLDEQRIPFSVVRGDGTRKGSGATIDDPHSQWWTDHYKTFFRPPASSEEKKYLSDLVYSKLTEEANARADTLRAHPEDSSFLLFDRTFVSRWFVQQQIDRGITLDDALHIKDPRSGKQVAPFIPDRTYILQVSRDELLKRIDQSTDSPEKKEFRRSNILKYYDLFLTTIHDLPSDYSGKKIVILEADQDPLHLHDQIVRKVYHEHIQPTSD